MNQHQLGKKQNPLFSAAVTGGIDDLGGIVLAAAAEKPVFTIGAAPVINDLDNFSEVSLDRDGNSEIGSGPIYSSPLAELDSFANLQNLHDAPPPTLDLDVNSNDQANYQQQHVDVNTNPISAAFGSAASSVFSTFTNIIKGSASQQLFDEQSQLQSTTPHQPHLPPSIPNENLNAGNPYGFISNQVDVNAPPPAFFSPGDENLFKKTEVEQTNNTFRLGSNKKKTYAHIPGLSSSQPQAVPQNFNLNPVMPPMPPQPVAHVDSMANFPPPATQINSYQNQQEVSPEKPTSNKFSFSSLLEKIPVTKNLFGSSNDDYQHQQPQQPVNEMYEYQDFTVTSQNYYSPPQQQQPQIQSQLNNESINFFNSSAQQQQQQQASGDLNQQQTIVSENVMPPTVNFFNPQQFNTSPFAVKTVQQPVEISQSINNQLISNHQREENSFNQTPPSVEQQRPPSTGNNFFNPPPTDFPTPPMPQTIFAPQSFSTPPPVVDAPPVSFFNPTETSEMFKSRHNDDGKPKNPYSNTRTRGVGLYKPRSSLTSESASAQVLLPPTITAAPVSQQFFTPTQVQEQQQQQPSVELTRPPSLPPPPLSTSSSTSAVIENTSRNSSISIENNLKNNDANLVQDKFFVKSEPNEQVSAINFFQVQANEVQQNPINFFSVEKKEAFDVKQEELNSTLQQTNDNSSILNDLTDKMESLSTCSRSTLSLFATSELDSTASALRQTAGLESLIPKYLETQQQEQQEQLQQQQQQHHQNLQLNEQNVERVPSVSPGINKNYRPVYCHWFYQNLYWNPFSMTDSLAIETAIASGEEVVNTNGGRYEVNIKEKRRSSIYWPSGSNAIRKCSWFYIDTLSENRNLIPYEEKISECLEKEYEKAITTSTWNHRIYLSELLPHQDFIIMKDAGNIEHHQMGQVLIVKRGLDEFDILDGEEGTADHLILCISNFGDKIDDNADEVRSKCMETLQQYYSEAFDNGQISRIEVLPIALNSIDVLKMFELNALIENASKIKNVPRDVNRHVMCTMLYSNENFYQKIINHLAFSLNEIVSKFRQRNPNFNGGISLISASYEALFTFDLLLANQLSDNISDFWKLNFELSKFFACGMPISLLTIRNGDKLRHGFELTICKKFFNILHPFDTLSQRIEPLIIPEYAALPPENLENLSSCERIDFILPEDSTLEKFTTNIYFSSEILVRSLANEIYGANRMDSGSM